MKTFIKITFSGGKTCVCLPNDVVDLFVAGCSTSEVQMTEEDFNALPEFQG